MNAIDQALEKANILDDLLACTTDFESGYPISGADFIEWFAEWRESVKYTLAANEVSE